MKITLRSDDKGFLVGDRIELGGMVDHIGGIREDVGSILELLRDAKNAAIREKEKPSKTPVAPRPQNNDRNKRPITVEVKPLLRVDQGRKQRDINPKPVVIDSPSNTNNPEDNKPPSQEIKPATVTPTISAGDNNVSLVPAENTPKPVTQTPTIQRARDSKGRFISTQPTVESRPVKEPLAKGESAINNKGRDAKGRFTAKDDESSSTLSRIKDGIGKVNEHLESMAMDSDVDPTIQAMGEVKEVTSQMATVVAAPMMAVDALFGRDKEKDKKRWYQKLFNQLRWMRRDTGLYHQRELAVLRDIEDKPEGGNRVS